MTTHHDHKHWASHQPAKQDEVKDLAARGMDWVLTRRREVTIGLGVALAAAVVAGFVVYSRSVKENQAWESLGMAEVYAYYGKHAEAREKLAEAAQGSQAAAVLAGIAEGELLQTQGKHDEAIAAFDRAAQSGAENLRPFALADKAHALDAAKKHAECAVAAQSFADAYPDHFLTAAVLELSARCLAASGQADAAKAVLQKLALQYPDTAWAARANAQLQPAASKPAKK